MAVERDEEFLLAIWDPADPLLQKTYRDSLCESSAGLPWMFGADALRVTLSYDGYPNGTFADIP